jgi:flagellar hook assembly protein FlgD
MNNYELLKIENKVLKSKLYRSQYYERHKAKLLDYSRKYYNENKEVKEPKEKKIHWKGIKNSGIKVNKGKYILDFN